MRQRGTGGPEQLWAATHTVVLTVDNSGCLPATNKRLTDCCSLTGDCFSIQLVEG